VHLNSSKAGGLGSLAARMAGVPRIVFTSHGLAYDEPRFILFRFAIFLATWTTFLLSQVVICISEDSARRARSLPFCGKKVHRIYNGLREPDFHTREEARAEILARAGDIPADAPWVGMISELVPNKGIPFAIRASENLMHSGVPFVLLIIGSGELEEPLRAQIERRGLGKHVRLLGYIPRAATLMRAFDLFILSSRKEGLPYVLLEAGLASLPVVATDIPGVTDIIDDGVSGALCPSNDYERFADSISGLLEDPSLRDRFGSKLRTKVQENFSIEQMVNETTALYH